MSTVRTAASYLETLFAGYQISPGDATNVDNVGARLVRAYKLRIATRIIPAIKLFLGAADLPETETGEEWRRVYAQGIVVDNIAPRVAALRAAKYSLVEIGYLIYMLLRTAKRGTMPPVPTVSLAPIEDALRLLCDLEPREFIDKIATVLSRHGTQPSIFQTNVEIRDMTHANYIRQFIVPLIDPAIPDRTRIAREIKRLFQLFDEPAIPAVPDKQARADEIASLFQGFAFVVSGSAH